MTERKYALSIDKRDKDVTDAVRQFFTEGGGDMYELEHVIQAAVESITVNKLNLTTVALAALHKNKLFTVRDIMDLRYKDLVLLPGVSHTLAGQIVESLAIFRRTFHVRPAGSVAADSQATASA